MRRRCAARSTSARTRPARRSRRRCVAHAPQWAGWAGALDNGSPKDRELAAGLRRASAATDVDDRLSAYLGAFFTKDGKPRGGDRSSASSPTRSPSACPACRSALPPNRSGLIGRARATAPRRGARAQRRALSRRRGDDQALCGAERGRAACSTTTISSPARARCSNAPTRPGCSTNSTLRSSICWSTKRRTLRRRNGRSSPS